MKYIESGVPVNAQLDPTALPANRYQRLSSSHAIDCRGGNHAIVLLRVLKKHT
ncbi:hypothetical protein [Xanthomonas hydrangeae]|uniref:hypothetical protein n=1 Tax=Xanthomonas hydrangeae TaxID=2775159 RepID=UPI0019662B0E